MFFEKPKNWARSGARSGHSNGFSGGFPGGWPAATSRSGVLWLTVAAAVLAAAGCGGPTADGGKLARKAAVGGRPRILVTTTVVADLVRQVAGDRVEVDCLMPPGIDPHSYKATPRDAERLLEADLVVASGLHLEGRLAALLARLADRVAVLSVADRLPANRILEAAGGIPDPHVWFDAGLWSLLPAEVARALAAIDPAGAETYAARAETYAARLREADAEARERLATIPPDRRVLVTAHDAFRYFGVAYGFEVRGLQGISTVLAAGVKDRRTIADLVIERGIKAIFVESSVPADTIEAVREDCREKGHEVVIGGELFSDAMGDTFPEDTYIGMVRSNVTKIVKALR